MVMQLLQRYYCPSNQSIKQQPVDAILSTKLNFIDKIGLTAHLSPTRANGLLGMIKQIKTLQWCII